MGTEIESAEIKTKFLHAPKRGMKRFCSPEYYEME